MTYVLVPTMIVVIAAVQQFFTSRVLRSPSYFIGQVTGGYAVEVVLLAIGLCVPCALGMDVGVAASVAITTIIVSSTVEMMVTIHKRMMNVDALSDTQ